jgi:hypothetical protein
MLIIGSRANCNAAKALIGNKWKHKDLGEAKLFVGFNIERNRSERTIKIHQTIYAQRILERFNLHQANSTNLPIPAGTVLKRLDEYNTEVESHELEGKDIEVYRQIVGSLIYLSNGTRFDLGYAVGQLARHMANPLLLHLQHAKQVLRYLRGTLNYGITYGPRTLNTESPNSHKYTLYSDATWGTEGDRVSFQGWIVLRYGGAVSWISQRQRSTAQSSLEAELIAANEASKEAAWLEKLSNDLREPSESPPTLYCDNEGTIEMIHNPKFHSKTKHIDIRCQYIRNDMVEKNRLVIEHIAGKDQPADALTKQLPIDQFRRFIYELGILEAKGPRPRRGKRTHAKEQQ